MDLGQLNDVQKAVLKQVFLQIPYGNVIWGILSSRFKRNQNKTTGENLFVLILCDFLLNVLGEILLRRTLNFSHFPIVPRSGQRLQITGAGRYLSSAMAHRYRMTFPTFSLAKR